MLRWLKKANKTKEFQVGDIVKEKETGREGLIINKYLDRYIIEFSKVADNPLKKK